MTDKELKKLGRTELLEILLEQRKETDRLESIIVSLRKEAEEVKIEKEKAGSLAEAALAVNGVFNAAEAAAKQYLDNIRLKSEMCEEECARKIAEAEAKAQKIIADAEENAERSKKSADEYWQRLVEKYELLQSE